MTTIHEPTGVREFTAGVTFRAFRQVAARRGWTVDGLLVLLAARHETFGGPRESAFYEPPKAYLHRVLRRGHAGDDDHVVPYRCLIRLYVEAVTHDGRLSPGERPCVCGCGEGVRGRRQYATAACRKRAERERRVSGVRDCPDRPQNLHVPQGLFRDISAGPVSGYPCHTSAAQIGSAAGWADERAHRGDGPVGTGASA